jgi:hypothetical protein
MTRIAVTATAIATWSLVLVISRNLLLHHGFNPWSFSFVQLLAGGLLFALFPGRSGAEQTPLAHRLRPLTDPRTLLLGLLRVLSASSFTAAVVHVTVSEASVIGSISVTLSAISVWVLFKRRPAPWEWLGHGMLIALILILIPSLDGGWRNPAILLLVFNEFCVVASSLIAERHPDNLKDDTSTRVRFTGSVLLVTAALLLAIRLIDRESGTQFDELVVSLPVPLVVYGIIVGITLRAPAMLFSFWSIRLIGAQNYMAAAASLPLAGLAMAGIAEYMGLLPVTAVLPQLANAVLVQLACLMILAARWHDERVQQPDHRLG